MGFTLLGKFLSLYLSSRTFKNYLVTLKTVSADWRNEPRSIKIQFQIIWQRLRRSRPEQQQRRKQQLLEQRLCPDPNPGGPDSPPADGGLEVSEASVTAPVGPGFAAHPASGQWRVEEQN